MAYTGNGPDGLKTGDGFKLLLNMDPNVPVHFFPNKPSENDIHDVTDKIHSGGIDIFSYCIFAEGLSHIRDSKYTEPHFFSYDKYLYLYKAGKDPVDLYIERCHRHGMRFMAGFRMNDRHPHKKGRFQEEHPEWQIWPDGGKYERGAMDFSHIEVREWMLNIAAEVLDKYGVDGIELDYMRWCHMFLPSKAKEQAYLLTEYMRGIRKFLDEDGLKRGRKLLIGVRVPQRLREAEELGCDLNAWIGEGLVDYICPSDFMYTDFNAPYEEFTELAGASGCTIYPSLHPMISQLITGAVLSRAQYRAVTERLHAAGADGISLYNFQFHWEQCMNLANPGIPSNYIDLLKFVRELKEPEKLYAEARHYVFLPLWEKAWQNGDHSKPRISEEADPPTGVKGVEGVSRMLLIDRKEKDKRKAYRFYLGIEDCDGQRNWQLLFNAANLTDRDSFDLDINGKSIGPLDIQAAYCPEGLNVSHRRPLCPYMKVRIFLGGYPLRKGKNELGFILKKNGGTAEYRIELQEVEVILSP